MLAEEAILRAVIVVAALVASSSWAIATECSLELQDRWVASTQEIQRLNQVTRGNNIRLRTGKDTLCTFARLMPSFVKTAREYFAACDPTGGTWAIADIEALFRRTSQYEQASCGK
jgi:hypothetical protein